MSTVTFKPSVCYHTRELDSVHRVDMHSKSEASPVSVQGMRLIGEGPAFTLVYQYPQPPALCDPLVDDLMDDPVDDLVNDLVDLVEEDLVLDSRIIQDFNVCLGC